MAVMVDDDNDDDDDVIVVHATVDMVVVIYVRMLRYSSLLNYLYVPKMSRAWRYGR